MKDKKGKLFLVVISVFATGFFLFFLNSIRMAKYHSKTTEVTLSYPKKSTKVEAVKDDRETVDEHVKFEISDRKFEENLAVELVITNDFNSDTYCVEIKCSSLFLDNYSSDEICRTCGYLEEFVQCDEINSTFSHCPYYKDGYIIDGKSETIIQRFGPIASYVATASHWGEVPDNFQGDWPEGKTRKIYTLFIASKYQTESIKGKSIRIIAWFKTGDKKAEKFADRIARYGVDIEK